MPSQFEHGSSVADEVSSDVMMRRDPIVSRDMPMTRRDSQVRRAPNSAGLYDVLDLILDKGIVIDAFVRVSLVGIELVTVDLRVVIASVDTYLRYAEGAERLQLYNRGQEKKLTDVVEGGMEKGMMAKGAKKLTGALTGDGKQGQGDGEEPGVGEKLADGVRNVLHRGVGGIMRKLSGDEDDDDKGSHGKHGDNGGREQRHKSSNGRDRERHGSSKHAGVRR